MKKLDPPTCTASRLFDLCTQEIADPALKACLEAEKKLVEAKFIDYETHSGTQTWYQLPRVGRGDKDQVIVGSLTKRELTGLYTKGMVASKGDARKEYDHIRLIARDECPYCGGCGEMVVEDAVGSLDHFLPKSRFPVYSVLPSNLVPACDVCNKGMGSSFPTDPNLQPLHPYFDAPHFFEQKWTTASVEEQNPPMVNFGVSPPADWAEKDKQRVAQHFKSCKLSGRYRSKVNSRISSLVDQRKNAHRDLTVAQFRSGLRDVADNPNLPINGWERTLYHALAESDWFCTDDFAD
jgi:hypothetical protein